MWNTTSDRILDDSGVLISAVVVNRDRADLLRAALASLAVALEATGSSTEIIVVDNASTDDSRVMLAREFPAVQVVPLEENVGFPAAVNLAVERTTGEWILLLNNDATIERNALGHVFAEPSPDDVGAFAMQMRFAARPDLVNSAGIGLDVLGVASDRLLGEPVAGDAARPADVFGASAGAALYRRAMLEQVGGFDGRGFLYLEDVDVAWRARMAGWRTLYVPGAIVWHHHSATSAHGSNFKYFHVGRNRIRLLARNAESRQLLRHGPAILMYELAYVGYVAVVDRSLAPLRGRLAGLREWRSLRREGAAHRRPVQLAPRAGFREALRRRRAWRVGGSPAG
jgi:GT2 family glycosyltransferase